MSLRSICAYISILSISLVALLSSPALYAQADTTATDTTQAPKPKKKDLAGHQLCLGVDIFHPIINNIIGNQTGYEFAADYYLHNEYYFAGEGGWGSANVNYSDLKYSTTNTFIRLGFNKSVLNRDGPKDWDMMMIGMRLGFANITRSAATYTVTDSVWGNSDSSHVGKSFPALWIEINGGMRVELLKNFFAGWNIRGKFMLNGRSFNDLAPLYIAGYGKGDKNSNFDFNVYLSYALRWDKKGVKVVEKGR